MIRLEEQIRGVQRTMERLEREHARGDRRGASTGAISFPMTPRAKSSRDSMDFNKLTIKSQEAIAAAQEDARRRGNPRFPSTSARAARPGLCLASSCRIRRAARGNRGETPRQAGAPGAAQQPQRLDRALARCSIAPRRRCASSRTSSSRPSTSCSRSTPSPATSCSRAQGGARRAARHLPGPRGHLPGAREVRPRPDRSSPSRASSTRSSAATRRSGA